MLAYPQYLIYKEYSCWLKTSKTCWHLSKLWSLFDSFFFRAFIHRSWVPVAFVSLEKIQLSHSFYTIQEVVNFQSYQKLSSFSRETIVAQRSSNWSEVTAVRSSFYVRRCALPINEHLSLSISTRSRCACQSAAPEATHTSFISQLVIWWVLTFVDTIPIPQDWNWPFGPDFVTFWLPRVPFWHFWFTKALTLQPWP